MDGISVVWYQYLPENTKWNFGNLRSIKNADGQCLENWKAWGQTKTKTDNLVVPKQSSISVVLNKTETPDGGISIHL